MRLLVCTFTFAIVLAGPAAAADLTVSPTAAGALEAHRGKPWYVPLNNCAGFHIFNGRRLKEAGDASGSAAETAKAADFMTAAATRISQDQGKTYDQAFAGNQRKVQNAVTALEMAIAPPDPAAWTKVCGEIMAGYRKVVG
ncbi:MAG TPA: hypothetical protein VEA44_15660 [Caulobacter sp.]|nr:hypothetical protein [Caulobacter sp.]